MDKNQIHIDELVRHKLGGAEESERPGAWLHMRDLLDKQMPTKAPAAYNWRRMMAVVTGVAVLATVGITGYEMSTSSRPDMPVAEATGPGGASRNAGNGLARNAQLPQGAANNNTPVNAAEEPVVSTGTATTARGTTSTAKPDVTAAVTPAATNTARNTTAPTTGKPKAIVSASGTTINNSSSNNNNLNTATTTNTTTTNNSVANNAAGTNVPSGGNVNNTNNRNNSNANNTVAAALPTANNTTAPNAGTTTGNNSNTNNSTVNTTTTPAPNTAVAPNTATTAAPAPAPTQRITVQMRYMEIVERYNAKNRYYKLDTVEDGYVAVVREVPMPVASEQLTNAAPVNNTNRPQLPIAANAKLTPPAATTINANAGSQLGVSETLVPLSGSRVSSERKGQGWANTSQKLDEMVKNAKFQMSQVRFYPGVIMGVNSALSGHGTMNGFHLGVTGLLVFGDRWSLLSELKYQQRFNSGVTVNDNYVNSTYVDPTTQLLQNDSVQHYFKFSTLNNVSLPLSLRYNFNRFNVFGGVNLAYFFAINTEEVDRVYKTTSAPMGTGPSITYNWREGAPKVSVDDFGPRFGMGYLLGASYELSPAMQLDLRMTQQLFDNARTPGAKIISQEIYKMPTLQLSILYRFSSNRHMRGR